MEIEEIESLVILDLIILFSKDIYNARTYLLTSTSKATGHDAFLNHQTLYSPYPNTPCDPM